MLSKYGNCTRLLKIKNKLKIAVFLQIKSGKILDILWAFLNKTIIPLALVGYEMIRASLAIFHRVSNAHSWNNC